MLTIHYHNIQLYFFYNNAETLVLFHEMKAAPIYNVINEAKCSRIALYVYCMPRTYSMNLLKEYCFYVCLLLKPAGEIVDFSFCIVNL